MRTDPELMKTVHTEAYRDFGIRAVINQIGELSVKVIDATRMPVHEGNSIMDARIAVDELLAKRKRYSKR